MVTFYVKTCKKCLATTKSFQTITENCKWCGERFDNKYTGDEPFLNDLTRPSEYVGCLKKGDL